MTTMSEEPRKLDEAALLSEAASVERLRRHISELPSKGEVVTPQLLAQFAVAQKRYLDRKIEFEKQRRSGAPGSGVRTTPTVPVVKPETKVPVKPETLPIEKPVPVKIAEPVAAAPTVSSQPAPVKVPVPAIETPQPKRALPIGWIIAAVAIALGVAAWLLVWN